MNEIKKFRVVNGLTQSQLGDYLGVGKSFLSSIETGRAKLPPEKFSKLLNNDQGWDVSMLISNSPSIKIGNVTANASNGPSGLSDNKNLEVLKAENALLKAENESLKAQIATLSRVVENLTTK